LTSVRLAPADTQRAIGVSANREYWRCGQKVEAIKRKIERRRAFCVIRPAIHPPRSYEKSPPGPAFSIDTLFVCYLIVSFRWLSSGACLTIVIL
jgi:hypothetical protein